MLITAHKRSFGQGNIFSSVCQEFSSRGGLPRCMLGYHLPLGTGTPSEETPQEQTPPGAGTPGADTPPRSRPPLGADTPLGAGTHPDQASLQEQTPPRCRHPQGADTPRSRHPMEAGTPQIRHPPGADTPQGADTPSAPAQCMLGDMVNKRAVCILLVCNLVPIEFVINGTQCILYDISYIE